MASPNQIEKNVLKSARWVRDNQERFWAITGGVFLSLLFIGLVLHHRETESEEAWSQLGNIQGQLMQGKLDETQKGLTTWETRFQGSDAATYAKFMKADLLHRTSDYVQAAQIYADIVQTGRPEIVKPLALSAEASCEEMAGHIPQALILIKSFLDKYPDHYLAGPNYMAHARLLEMSGDSAAAAAVYDRFILLFPQSPWTDLARSRTHALGASSSRTMPGPAPLIH